MLKKSILMLALSITITACSASKNKYQTAAPNCYNFAHYNYTAGVVYGLESLKSVSMELWELVKNKVDSNSPEITAFELYCEEQIEKDPSSAEVLTKMPKYKHLFQ